MYRIYVNGSVVDKAVLGKVEAVAGAPPRMTFLMSGASVDVGDSVRLDLLVGEEGSEVWQTWFSGVVHRVRDRTGGQGELLEVLAVSRLERVLNGFIDLEEEHEVPLTYLPTYIACSSDFSECWFNRVRGSSEYEVIDGLLGKAVNDDELLNTSVKVRYSGELTALLRHIYSRSPYVVTAVPNGNEELLLVLKKEWVMFDLVRYVPGLGGFGFVDGGGSIEGSYGGVVVRAWSKPKDVSEDVTVPDGGEVQMQYIAVAEPKVYLLDSNGNEVAELCKGVDYDIEQDPEKPLKLVFSDVWVGSNVRVRYRAVKLAVVKRVLESFPVSKRFKYVELHNFSTLEDVDADASAYADKLLSGLGEKTVLRFKSPIAFRNENGKLVYHPALANAGFSIELLGEAEPFEVRGFIAGLTGKYRADVNDEGKMYHVKKVEYSVKDGVVIELAPPQKYVGLDEVVVEHGVKLQTIKLVPTLGSTLVGGFKPL